MESQPFFLVMWKSFIIFVKNYYMRKSLLVIVIGLMFVGCYKEPQSSESVGNGFRVEYLFEKDGIKVYRFYDGGRSHYFTSKGESISTQSNGKTTTDENIE
jgi:hypothetical protein